MNVLVGDIGGTKTALAIVDSNMGPHHLINEKYFPSAQYASIDVIISEYLSSISLKIDSICLVVAGPVIAGQAKITNLPWVMDEENLREKFKVGRVKILNDLEGMAYAIPILKEEDSISLYVGSPVEGGAIAVIAPGTGLGESFLTKHGKDYHAHPSEGGHASFSPIDPLQIELLEFLKQKKNLTHVSVERVCSGSLGIPNLYTFLKETGKYPEPEWLNQRLANCEDMAPIIFSAAQDPNNPSEICVATLELFCSILAVEAGNLALKILSTGGIYLGGGIPPRILALLKKEIFTKTLLDKGRFTEVLANMPIKVIMNTKAPLMGGGAYGLR